MTGSSPWETPIIGMNARSDIRMMMPTAATRRAGLRDDGRPGGPGHAHLRERPDAEDQERVQDDIDHGPGNHDDHRLDGIAGAADQTAYDRPQDKQRRP